MRFFNTAGPVRPELHYGLSPLARLHLDELMHLIDAQKYFILHAPRQTGKTSALLALRDQLNAQAHYRCLYVNIESAQAAREQVAEALRTILFDLSDAAAITLDDSWPQEHFEHCLHQAGAHGALRALLSRWAAANSKPLVLLIDEIDALIGDTLISVLRQLRAGYTQRPTHFPQCVVLCGVRDVRDYRIHSSSENTIITGGSAFNVKAASLRLGNFSAEEIKALLAQHTEDTGQVFEPAVLARMWPLTEGQPWLVNALAHELTHEMRPYRDRSRPITLEALEQARENLILRRDTHLDQLADKLREPRVQRVIEPLLAGEGEAGIFPDDDLSYVRDLGLVALENPVRIANAIYREVIPRQLNFTTQATLVQETAWYVADDGRLDLDALLAAFQQFFREHSESWLERFDYREAGPQLLMQAFLQRIVNGGGRVEREYGLGRKRTDLLLIWPYTGGVQRAVIELKLLRQSPEKTLEQGIAQTWGYADRCGADEAHLVLFDRRTGRSWEERIQRQVHSHKGREIVVWGV